MPLHVPSCINIILYKFYIKHNSEIILKHIINEVPKKFRVYNASAYLLLQILRSNVKPLDNKFVTSLMIDESTSFPSVS